MSCSGQCILVDWTAVSVANFKVELVSGEPLLCKADTTSLTNLLLAEAQAQINRQTGSPVITRTDCDIEKDDCDCGWSNAKDEIVLTKSYPYSITYSETITKKVGGKVITERTCESKVSGDVTCQKHRRTAECSPRKIQPAAKKYYLVKYDESDALVAVPPGDDWAEAIAAALSKASAG
jgi:hypothetical protein